jgi:hypothetical protein
VVRSLCREDGYYNCCWPSPAQSFSGPSPVRLVTIFYCLGFETSVFVASYDSQNYGGGIRPRLHNSQISHVSPCYNLEATDHHLKRFPSYILCLSVATKRMFGEPLASNGLPRLFIATKTCLASRWIAMDFRSGSTIPVFRSHVTTYKAHNVAWRMKIPCSFY